MPRYYFDYNATTPLAPSILEQWPQWVQNYGNPSSTHFEGRQARKQLEEARKRIAGTLGCFADEIIFTMGASESNAHVFRSVWDTRKSNQNEILISSVEHDAVAQNARTLQAKGAVILSIPVSKQGELDLDFLQAKLSKNTLLVSCMLANNETGFIFPLKEVALLCRQKGILLHTDAACGMGKLNFNFQDLSPDLVSFSAHKFHGPRGVGGLIVRKGTPLNALILGGIQEHGQRAGTENLPGIMGLALALDYALKDPIQEVKRLWDLRKILKEGLLKKIEGIEFIENESNQFQLPGTLSCLIPQVSGQTFLAALDLAGVAASLGSACHSGSLNTSRIILALGIPEEKARGVLRLSFGRMTTRQDVDELIEIMGGVFWKMLH